MGKQILFIFFFALLLRPSTMTAQLFHFTGDCYDIRVNSVSVNGVTADTVFVAPGFPVQVTLNLQIQYLGCFDLSATSFAFGYHAETGVQWGRCIYATSGFIFRNGNLTPIVSSFVMPTPAYDGIYYLNFSKSSENLVVGTESYYVGGHVAIGPTDTTAMVLVVQPSTPHTPWVSNGSFLYYNAGNVGIGTATPSSNYKLSVNGNIRTKKVVVETGWADHVFEPGYPLPPLDSVRAYVARNGHLPGIPSAAEIEAQGLDVGSVQRDMMAKIEELTLYMLEMQAENARLRRRLEVLEEKGDGLKPEEKTIEGGKGK